ncbi:MAG: hypothetical protein ACEQSU_14010 [Microgenomates group bacterium]
MSWNDFNDAEEHVDRTGLIPTGTLVKVSMKIKPGGFNDASKGWVGGYATQGGTGSVYLAPEYTVLSGIYAKRKVFKSLIGLYSPKGPEWGNSGRAFLRAALESARGIAATDTSERAMSARRAELSDLDGLVFVAKVGIEKGNDGYEDSNKIETVIGVSHKDYAALMAGADMPSAAVASLSQTAKAAAKPAWAS